MLDDSLLDDPARLADADAGGLLRAAATAGAQVRAAEETAADADLAARLDPRHQRPRSLVLLDRSGVSGSCMRLLSALLGPSCPVPVVGSNLVPSWIGALDVVLAYTDDPGDRQLADSIGRAARFGATVVLAAPEDGPIAASVAGKGVLLPPRVPAAPELSFSRALAVALLTARALGLLDTDLGALADHLDGEAERDHLSHESFVNPAKALALRLAGHTPLLWGLDPVAVAVAARGAQAFATHAATVCDVAGYRDVAARTALYRAAVSGTSGRDIFADPDDDAGPRPPRVQLLQVTDENETLADRREAEDLLAGADLIAPGAEIEADVPARAAVLGYRLELAAVYLGLATGSIGGAGRYAPARA